MPKVFAGLAISNLILLLATGGLGLVTPEVVTQDQHVVLGVFTCLLSCFTQIVTFMYFAVTGKLVMQAVHLGKMDLNPINNSKVLRKSAGKCVGALVVSLVPVIATGAVRWGGGEPTWTHLIFVGLTIPVHAIVLFREWPLIERNVTLVSATLDQYREIQKKQQGGSTAASTEP